MKQTGKKLICNVELFIEVKVQTCECVTLEDESSGASSPEESDS